MLYADGQDPKLGDAVYLSGGMTGVVRVLVDAGLHDDGFAPEEWSHLGDGLLVESGEAGLVHYPAETVERLTLVQRRD